MYLIYIQTVNKWACILKGISSKENYKMFFLLIFLSVRKWMCIILCIFPESFSCQSFLYKCCFDLSKVEEGQKLAEQLDVTKAEAEKFKQALEESRTLLSKKEKQVRNANLSFYSRLADLCWPYMTVVHSANSFIT